MRGFTLRALPVCFVAVAAGCFSPGGTVATKTGPATTRTHEYWRQVSAALAQKPSADDMKGLVKLVRAQTDTLRDLSPDGVDPSLASAVEDLVRCEDEVLRIAATVDNDPGYLKENQVLAKSFSEANRKASESKKRLKALRDSLNARYGGGFAAIG
jgi:hypothetical protein